MIEPTTSTTPDAAEDAARNAPAEASSGSADRDTVRADSSNAFEPESALSSAEETGEVPEDNPGGENPRVDEGDGEDAEPEESEADKVARLEREGDIAADYLEELLDIADLDGDIDLDVEGDRALVAVVGGDLRRLTGPDGAVLEALQELTRLAVLRETGNRSRLMLDVGGFRERRRQDLEKRAAKVADEVDQTGKPVRMDPMTPFERKIVHDTVAAKGLTSESEGEEPNRRVVVKPQSR